jgi:BirA family biotin operon repressor/biotin-[acetyl-CoA-carboxylase] ligase
MYSQLELPGFSHARRYDAVSSTMDVARELLRYEPPHSESWCAVVAAEAQTAGRGRQGRSWVTTRGAFMATYLFATDAPVAAFAGYSLAVGVAVSAALEEYGVRTRLKWPNDIVVIESGGKLRKLGGVLIEVQELGAYRCILVGLGLNTTQPPDDVRDIAVGMQELGAPNVSAPDLLEPIGIALRVSHHRFVHEGGFKASRDAWAQRSCFVPHKTTVELDVGEGQRVTGRFAGVDEMGALVVDVGGRQQTVLSGHITSFQLGGEQR